MEPTSMVVVFAWPRNYRRKNLKLGWMRYEDRRRPVSTNLIVLKTPSILRIGILVSMVPVINGINWMLCAILTKQCGINMDQWRALLLNKTHVSYSVQLWLPFSCFMLIFVPIQKSMRHRTCNCFLMVFTLSPKYKFKHFDILIMAPSKIGIDHPKPQLETIQYVMYRSINGGSRFFKTLQQKWSIDKLSLEFPYVCRCTALSLIVASSPRAKTSFWRGAIIKIPKKIIFRGWKIKGAQLHRGHNWRQYGIWIVQWK